jgi:hypothetical protein|tara:strand:- start:340 stop:588 length:249 start_codon:yes stop_codon:yes gene_type:complete
MSGGIEQQLQKNTSLFDKVLDGTKVELTKKNIEMADKNSINVVNNGFAYDEYFKMGGTVAKMTFQSTKNFKDFVKNRSQENN